LRPYGLLTLHRPSNVDSKEVLTRLTDVLSRVARDLPIIFPVHPRTRKQLTAFGLLGRFEELSSPVKASGIHLVPPLGYLAFLNLTSKASLVLTDSGGIQEETTILGVPCITLRENTERPVTVTHGTNTVVGTSPRKILAACRKALEPSPGKKTLRPRLWDGRAAERIVSVIARKMMG
jgi:UDP-N-acetylglucosamine 2-epimerase (non-hydrolysing)